MGEKPRVVSPGPEAEMSSLVENDLAQSMTVQLIQAMLDKEKNSYAPCEDYIAAFQADSGPSSSHINEHWRRRHCEWCFEVVDQFGFDREVVSIALSYLDRVVSSKARSSTEAISRRDYQLIAVASLYLAIKLHGEQDSPERPRKKLRIVAYVELSRGMFQVETIEAMERTILEVLKWKVNPPTAASFVAQYVRLLSPAQGCLQDLDPVAESILDTARYICELSASVSTFSFHSSPSIVAYAAVLCALDSEQGRCRLAYESRQKFLNRLATATSLVPGMNDVRRVYVLLNELYLSYLESLNRADAQAVNLVEPDREDEEPSSPHREEPVGVDASSPTSTSYVRNTTEQDFPPNKRCRISCDCPC